MFLRKKILFGKNIFKAIKYINDNNFYVFVITINLVLEEVFIMSMILILCIYGLIKNLIPMARILMIFLFSLFQKVKNIHQ